MVFVNIKDDNFVALNTLPFAAIVNWFNLKK